MRLRPLNLVRTRWAGCVLPLLTAVAAFGPTSVHAGPCAAEVDNLQAKVDAQIDATASTGRMARESTAVTDHHQPTPDSIARAEEALGEGPSYGQVLAALAQAREADRAGDVAACEQALGAARATLGR